MTSVLRVARAPQLSTVLFCCVLFTCCFSMVAGQIAVDCCLEVANKAVPKGAVVDYSVQVSGQGCRINAIILMTRQRRTICILPSHPKLQQILNHVDKLKRHCQEKGYKGRRCVGVKP